MSRGTSMSKEIVTSNTCMPSQWKSFWTTASILFLVGLHPVTANAQSDAPSDPQIVGIVSAADQIDINYAKLALSKTNDKQVKDFAQQMITDHTSVQKAVADLAANHSLNVKPLLSDSNCPMV